MYMLARLSCVKHPRPMATREVEFTSRIELTFLTHTLDYLRLGGRHEQHFRTQASRLPWPDFSFSDCRLRRPAARPAASPIDCALIVIISISCLLLFLYYCYYFHYY